MSLSEMDSNLQRKICSFYKMFQNFKLVKPLFKGHSEFSKGISPSRIGFSLIKIWPKEWLQVLKYSFSPFSIPFLSLSYFYYLLPSVHNVLLLQRLQPKCSTFVRIDAHLQKMRIQIPLSFPGATPNLTPFKMVLCQFHKK